MQEVGIDISSQRPKRVSQVPLGDVDTIVTLCIEEVCVIPGEELRRETWRLPDPLAASGPDAKVDEAFRLVRDELRWRIEDLFAQLPA
jgi:arsenate reductase